MNEPTDAEIDALLRPFYESDDAAEMAKYDDRLTARAVLAKWGAPPAVAGGAIAEVVMAARPPKASPAWLPHKIIHASLQWLDSVPVGTKLYPPAAHPGAGSTSIWSEVFPDVFRGKRVLKGLLRWKESRNTGAGRCGAADGISNLRGYHGVQRL